MGHGFLHLHSTGVVHKLLHKNVSTKYEKQRTQQKGILEDWRTENLEWTLIRRKYIWKLNDYHCDMNIYGLV